MQNEESNPVLKRLEEPFHHWKERLYVGICMLILAFVGVVITNIKQDGAWDYWRVICIIFAILSIGLNLYLRKRETKIVLGTIWHELFHWLGLFLAVGLVSSFVSVGVMAKMAASIEILTLLALSTYLVGVYIEPSFLIIGLVLGLFALGLSIATNYLYPIIILLLLIGGVGLWFYVKRKHIRHKPQ